MSGLIGKITGAIPLGDYTIIGGITPLGVDFATPALSAIPTGTAGIGNKFVTLGGGGAIPISIGPSGASIVASGAAVAGPIAGGGKIGGGYTVKGGRTEPFFTFTASAGIGDMSIQIRDAQPTAAPA